ncbi:sigma-70 family RNA polymerase sigma factor [Bradyrhizobium sp. Leo121]|uniref:RNA polymerase sigma factor n=1 Tax=Bradyrhizobium sp. Leo121 TaxID=1571195 RepID=UPI001028FD14|nr:sigma-70 family RNA polymerase sigma factor [Bradyrhizobium sp. Leo121]RZN36267.1 RNA polymerase subunit sigma-70 [Bradyrhizobium sp. Leo121]
MTETALTIIRRLFVDRYDDLKARLTQRLGSADLAGDAMQDTWLRLSRAESIGAVQSPRSYLFRIALNVAEDRRLMERRQRISAIEIESLLELPDHAPTPEQTMLARSDLEAFEAIVNELPGRRRVIFLAARVGNVPRQEIADRLSISRQLVAKELRLALEHCLARYKELKG